jgi:Flp pilus assembly protein TadD
VLTHYAKLTFWPSDLIALYGFARPLTLIEVLPAAICIVGLLAATIGICRRWPAVGFAGLWVFLTLAPSSSLIPIPTEIGAERRMYLPLIAIAALVAIAIWTIPRRTWVSAACTAALLLPLSVTTFARNRDYAMPLHLAEQTLGRWPTGIAHQYFAEELLKAGRREEAFTHLRIAVVDVDRSHLSLGTELYRDGKYDEALGELQTFVRLEPEHLYVPVAEGMIARIHARQERWNLASDFAQRALSKTAIDGNALAALGDVALNRGQFSTAITHYRRALGVTPTDIEATTKLGVAFMLNGQLDEGVGTFRRLTELAPDAWSLRRNLAQALLDANRPGESIVEARRTIAMSPNDSASHTILGQGLLGVGEVQEAAAEFERALALNPADEDARTLLARLRQ